MDILNEIVSYIQENLEQTIPESLRMSERRSNFQMRREVMMRNRDKPSFTLIYYCQYNIFKQISLMYIQTCKYLYFLNLN